MCLLTFRECAVVMYGFEWFRSCKTVENFQGFQLCVISFPDRALGLIMWEQVGMARNEAGLKEGIEQIRALREEYWQNVRVTGERANLNQALEMAGRVADFLELGELMAYDALQRTESCGGHFREEHQTPEGEAQRDDEDFAHVSAWAYDGEDSPPQEQREHLEFENVHLSVRSYK